ncbi:rhodanese-like domain-containing protein [Clostridium tagluense]|uniref:rhodanese-like domain-containing protein n=1 Tax=Clostridium tagluense TaxID=360422 RepID=UPI001C0D8D65|nr:rhodanese-like domain-containing protein [Clostridium tagluense]MBU3127811.1 rhodanese-like domain-containing protein [Clostridium tagluense]MCB2299099.1 rhodanese-like domain-containing protein [Clostridium tagluense]MCB2310163.1 rhodanese-like domain-containing protein [Clostridium tagluense]MCB2315195.1 rhodanese-like domain-containing protein [Clostridium tagluense]MCB2319863.1 rhodanese-like domain-containing protein [Clostridium tagluense]
MLTSTIKNVTAEEAYKLISENSEFVILDVRTKEEYDDGHIPGAKLFPVQILPRSLSELDEYKNKPVLVYCASGGRSPRAVDTLANNSFKNIYHLTRGLSSWRYNITR